MSVRQAYLTNLIASYSRGQHPGEGDKEEAWRAFLQTQEGVAPLAQLKAVNRYVNWTVVYVIDHSGFMRIDRWSGPHEALQFGGDCEDFALLKLISLHLLGWPEERLQIVLGARSYGDPTKGHALLLVTLDNGAQAVLDNQSALVMPPSEYFIDFVPKVAIGSKNWANLQRG